MIQLNKKVRRNSETIESYVCRCTCYERCICTGSTVRASLYNTLYYATESTSNHYAK